MIRTNLKTALRNLAANKFSAMINICGLTIGLAATLLISLWLLDEYSFDTWHKSYDKIGRVMIRGNDKKEGPFVNTSLPYPLSTTLMSEYKNQFKYIVRSSWDQDYILSSGDKKLSRAGLFMDADAPSLFSLKMVSGSARGLTDPHAVLLSESTAKALFNDDDPMNRTITINNKMNVKVTGVFEDLPQNTTFAHVKFLSTWDLWVSQNEWIGQRATNDWMNHFLRIYAELPDGSSFESVNRNIKNAELEKIKGIDKYAEHTARSPEVFLHPMSEWHFNRYTRGAETDRGPAQMVKLVSIIGIFILLLACINFMNLSTARSEKRAKEVGIRKTVGSGRFQLIQQFFGESFLVVVVSFLFSFILVILTLPSFNRLTEKEISIPWASYGFWLMATGFILITAMIAGSYPAFYLSSFKPIKVLKGTFRTGRKASLPRQVLVVFQFTVSVALIIGTIVVYRQVEFAKSRPAGYNQEGILMIEMKSADFAGKHDLFKTELLKTGAVESYAQSMGKLTEVASGNNGFEWKGKTPEQDESFGTLAVTTDFGKTVGWKFIAGRDFSNDRPSDSMGVVINRSAMNYMGLDNPAGETITWKWRDNAPKPYIILGVIEDMVMESPYNPVEPVLYFINALNGGPNWMHVKVKPQLSMHQALPKIEAVFNQLVPSAPFGYHFADEEFAKKFKREVLISNLVTIFAALAIFISCLGLFGLASFMAERRTREIGIRKVLGASVLNVCNLLSVQFVKLTLISLLIAGPLAWYFLNQWLQNYQYRTTVTWWIPAIAGLGSLVITLFVVSFQAIRAAFANPVKSLRTE